LLLFLQRDAELFERSQQLGIDLVETRLGRLLFRRAVVNDVLVIDLGILDVGPVLRLGHRQPVPKGFETKLQHPLGLVLLLDDETNRVFRQTARDHVRLDVRNEAVFVFLFA
jgi:hypothetical protein